MGTTAPLARAVTRGVARQVEAFGLLGAHLNQRLPRLSPDAETLRHLLDPAVLKEMDTAKAMAMPGMDDTRWVSERRLDASDLERLVVQRLRPCHPLFELADRNGDAPPDPDHPLLYQTNGWPDGAPPAGRVRQAPGFGWDALLKSHIAMLRLQLDRTKGAEAAIIWAGNKLIRAALWIVRTEGFLAAVDYLFSVLDHGFVIERDAIFWAFGRLFLMRRQVADDADLPGYLLVDANLDMAAWRSADLRITPPAPPVRELFDDLDLVIERVEERERAARAATDLDGWFLADARLGLAARAATSAMLVTGAARQFGYESHAKRFEEFSADAGASFHALLRDGATDRLGDALRPRWSMAVSFALIAKQEGDEWLRHMLGERVALPDALIPAFLEAPFAFVAPPEWQRPSPELSRVLAQLVYREVPIWRHRAVNGDRTTTALVAENFRATQHPHLTDLADRASTIWPLVHRDATSGPPPHDADGEILLTFLLYLSTRMPTEREEAKAWLDEQHRDGSEADLARSFEEPVEPGSRYDHEERLRRAEGYVADYPYDGSVRAGLALRRHEIGAAAEARRTVEEALLLDPGLEHVWATASLICHAAGDEEDDRVARAMRAYLELSGSG